MLHRQGSIQWAPQGQGVVNARMLSSQMSQVTRCSTSRLPQMRSGLLRCPSRGSKARLSGSSSQHGHQEPVNSISYGRHEETSIARYPQAVRGSFPCAVRCSLVIIINKATFAAQPRRRPLEPQGRQVGRASATLCKGIEDRVRAKDVAGASSVPR